MLLDKLLRSSGRTVLFMMVALGFTAPATAQDDGPAFPVDNVTMRYLRENPNHPSLDEAMQVAITLGTTSEGYVAPRPDVELVTMTVDEISTRPTEIYRASAIQHLLETLRDYFVAQDLLGVFVAPDPQSISETGLDLRPTGDDTLALLITTGIVTELRTIASGERVREGGEITPETRINNPLHQRIIERSPVQPSESLGETTDLLRKDELDRYLFHLGRHQGRRVDASISAAQDIGGLDLDYMVTENKPLTLYTQVSNTGTPSTDSVRYRFGLFHTQLTNNDDILSIDYTTTNFSELHGFTAAYERPFEDNDRIRWRAYYNYTDYTADAVGFLNENFKGNSWTLGGELVANIYQKRELFVDLIGGLRYYYTHVDNEVFLIEGAEDFVLPYIGVALERRKEWMSTRARLTLEFQVDDVDDQEINELGRTDPSHHWTVMRWTSSHSVFLEPLLDREAWEDPSTPESSTLAHELLLGCRGQLAFGNRLIPQETLPIGGMLSVRGYPESVVAGDSVIIGSVEYRYHVPRDYSVQPEPTELFGRSFRAAPQYVYGTPDWDLVLKGFFDVGYAYVSDKFSFEEDQTLYGAGIGLEVLYRRNLNIRLDWGFALDDLDPGQVNSGSNRLHVLATVMF